MKDRLLNKYQIESNGELITVETIETEKGIKVNIVGNTMDVIVNNDILYSKFDNEDYKYIPVNIREFVEKNLCSWSDGIVVKDEIVKCEVEINGEAYDIEIPKNTAKNKIMYINNWLNSYDKISEYDVDIDVSKARERFDKLLIDIKGVGYELVFRWDGNEYDDIYGLKLNINDFNEDKVLECMELWEGYDSELAEYIKKI